MMKMSKRYHSGAHFNKKPAILIESGAIFRRKKNKKSQQEKNIRPRGGTQRGPCVPKGPKYGTVDTNYDERDSRLMFFGLF